MFGSSTSRTCAKSSGFNKRGAAGVELAAHVTEAVASTKRMSPKNRTRFICGMAMPGRRASIPNSGKQFWQGDTAIGREPAVKIKKPSGIVRFLLTSQRLSEFDAPVANGASSEAAT